MRISLCIANGVRLLGWHLAAKRASLLKRISTLKRRVDLSEDNFRLKWIVHGDLVRKMPGVAAYRQNVAMAHERVKGQPCDYGELPIDGIVEIWFESAARRLSPRPRAA